MVTSTTVTTWTPEVPGLTPLEKDLLTVELNKGEKMTEQVYKRRLNNKLMNALDKEPDLPAILERWGLEPEEMEQLIWVLPGINRLRHLLQKNPLHGHRREQAYEVHPWSHYLPIWD